MSFGDTEFVVINEGNSICDCYYKNTCLHLSKEAEELYASLAGKLFHPNISRFDSNLIAVIRQLGDIANCNGSNFQIDECWTDKSFRMRYVYDVVKSDKGEEMKFNADKFEALTIL